MTSKFFIRLIYFLFFFIFILGFEWVNIEDQLGDQSFLETSIHVDSSLNAKQKTVAQQEVRETEKGMSTSLLVVKILLGISVPLLIYSFYKNEKLSG